MASYIIPCKPGFHCHISVAVSSLSTLPEFPIKLYLQHSRTLLACRSKRFPIPPVKKKFQRVASHTVRPFTTATPLLIPVFCIHCCSCQCDQIPCKKQLKEEVCFGLCFEGIQSSTVGKEWAVRTLWWYVKLEASCPTWSCIFF